MAVDLWKLKLSAFLHDPPDKAISISRHRERRDSFLFKPLGLSYAEYATIVETADHVSASMQRMNIPKEIEDIVIDFTRTDKDCWPKFIHPLSSSLHDIDIKKSIESSFVGAKNPEQKFLIERYECGISEMRTGDSKKEFFKVWRLLPKKATIYWDIPADTRIPDHTIWDHMDVTSALAPCVEDGIAFLSFKIGPVQEFIENAGKVSDLWSGSHLLSYLSFSGIRAVAEECGLDAVIFPYLRGQPFVDWWLFTQDIGTAPKKEQLRVSNIPHRFLAIVPQSKARYLSARVEKSVRDAWTEIGNNTVKKFHEKAIEIDNEFKKNWDRQISDAFHITTQILNWANPSEDADAVWRWFEAIHKILPGDLMGKYKKWLEHYKHDVRGQTTGFKPNAGSLYGLYYELIGTLIDQKSRFFEHIEEPKEVGGEKGGRCNLCGIRNPIRRKDQKPKQFWKEVQDKLTGMFKEGERLCAVCTVKRLYNSKEVNPFGVKCDVVSVATIAMMDFLDKCKPMPEYDDFLNKFNGIIGSAISSQIMDKDRPEGEWFYLESYDCESIKKEYGVAIDDGRLDELKKELKNLYEKVGKPPKYYAILVMDGDEMGKKLRGEKMPPLKDVLHPAVVNKFGEIGTYEQILDSPRILNPNIHTTISRALLEFSVNLVGSIIEKHKGLLVYSGGDDVLAVLPAEAALDTAREINDTFGKDFVKVGDRNVMLLGKDSTMSAGIVFAHYKYPLYDALERARKACEKAKDEYERNAFVLVDIRHSGQISIAGGKWEMTQTLEEFAKLMKIEKTDGGLSPRFVYRLLEDVDAIEKLDNEGKKAYLKYLLGRHLGEEKKAKINELSGKLIDTASIIAIEINEKRKEKKKEPIRSLQEIAYLLRILATIEKEGEK